MNDQRDTILLDPKSYNANTRKWTIPILRLPGLKLVTLHIDGEELKSTQYSIDKSVISINDESLTIKGTTKANGIIQFNPTNILTTFWLPIVLAAIGLLGTLGQPILHSIGILYSNEYHYEVDVSGWGYDDETHEFQTSIEIVPFREKKHIKNNELDDWKLYLAARKKENNIDIEQHKYTYLGGPFSLKTGLLETSVKANKALTESLKKEGGYAQCCIVLIKGGYVPQEGFCPADQANENIKVVGAVGVFIEKYNQSLDTTPISAPR